MRTCACAFLIVMLATSTALGRTWTSAKGTMVEADYVGHKDGKILLLIKTNGKVIAVLPEQLSAADQEYAAELAKNAKPFSPDLEIENRENGVKFLSAWKGEVPLERRTAAPTSGYVSRQQEWEKLWNAFRGTEEIPKIDFEKQLILVAVNGDPNPIRICTKLDDQGDLKLSYGSTLIGFTHPRTGAYQFALINRAGIKTVRGKPIETE